MCELLALGMEEESGRAARLYVIDRRQNNRFWHEIVTGEAINECGDGWERWLEPLEKAWRRGVRPL